MDSKTVKEYYQILVDTLVGSFVEPFKRRQTRQVISKAFEHFLHMELRAHRSYSELEYDIEFWRTKSGLEVDFVLGGGEVALEVKGGHRVGARDLRGLSAFMEEFKPKHALVVCNEPLQRR